MKKIGKIVFKIMKMKFVFFLLLSFFISVESVSARAGGGGSGSGGGSGGGGIVSLIFLIIFSIIAYYKRKKRIEKANLALKKAAEIDPAWNLENLKNRVSQLFAQFQLDWSTFNVDSMKEYLTEDYWQRIFLEMNVLKNQKRQNISQNLVLKKVEFFDVEDSADNNQDGFIVEVKGGGNDILQNVETAKLLYQDNRTFTEYWHFKRSGDVWKLNLISQKTADPSKTNKAMADFASKNSFYFDPDFGWLMMPDKGAIFSKTNFKISDINNHIIGFYKNKIVEFYTYIPKTTNYGLEHYFVAQAILPISYNNILIKKKKKFLNFKPRGLHKIELEWNDFNNKFCLWASPQDNVNSLVLLTPDFMEKIYDLKVDLNIEIVGNVLYFYIKHNLTTSYIRHNVATNADQYQELLKILSWAFDKMDN